VKKWSLNLTTLALNQVIKFDYNVKGVVYFEAENWREADKIVYALLNHEQIERINLVKKYFREVPEEVERAIVELCKN
jgi:hypothetical protein